MNVKTGSAYALPVLAIVVFGIGSLFVGGCIGNLTALRGSKSRGGRHLKKRGTTARYISRQFSVALNRPLTWAFSAPGWDSNPQPTD